MNRKPSLAFSSKIMIGPHEVSTASKVFIVAEAGVNHNGDMHLAMQLIDCAAEAGADAVKFQTFSADHLILKNVDKAPYQTATTDAGESQYDMLKKLEVTREQNTALQEYCNKKGILFLTTPFDEYSLEQLDGLNLPAYKISSTDITNLPFILRVAKKRKPIILSTGMTYLDEIQAVLQELAPVNRDVILLQCTSNYPVEDSEVHLNILHTLRSEFDMLVGYSDHTRGVGAAPYAAALGAKVIEKHFTLDKEMDGPDHKASLDPEELKRMVAQVRTVETYLGSYRKMPTLSERETRNALQKCLVAARPISAGECFSEQNIIAKRTGGRGISPLYCNEVIGKKAPCNFKANDIIRLKA